MDTIGKDTGRNRLAAELVEEVAHEMGVEVHREFENPFKCGFCGEVYEYGDPNHTHN